ncbi:Aste57867_18849 [Aphanomyces stellatus]|uniref:Aste57867_18849 protein n=1 Tax=Aphanomyces stellatus TaxID=120398 RepID=A0A485LCV9_9STRA|nr:hypothetical protein As57867_018785 [Aphanomyces stellatus]VFT95583.1 Aste57867_18849 [Aphanomyces stellatus]
MAKKRKNRNPNPIYAPPGARITATTPSTDESKDKEPAPKRAKSKIPTATTSTPAAPVAAKPAPVADLEAQIQARKRRFSSELPVRTTRSAAVGESIAAIQVATPPPSKRKKRQKKTGKDNLQTPGSASQGTSEVDTPLESKPTTRSASKSDGPVKKANKSKRPIAALNTANATPSKGTKTVPSTSTSELPSTPSGNVEVDKTDGVVLTQVAKQEKASAPERIQTPTADVPSLKETKKLLTEQPMPLNTAGPKAIPLVNSVLHIAPTRAKLADGVVASSPTTKPNKVGILAPSRQVPASKIVSLAPSNPIAKEFPVVSKNEVSLTTAVNSESIKVTASAAAKVTEVPKITQPAAPAKASVPKAKPTVEKAVAEEKLPASPQTKTQTPALTFTSIPEHLEPAERTLTQSSGSKTLQPTAAAKDVQKATPIASSEVLSTVITPQEPTVQPATGTGDSSTIPTTTPKTVATTVSSPSPPERRRSKLLSSIMNADATSDAPAQVVVPVPAAKAVVVNMSHADSISTTETPKLETPKQNTTAASASLKPQTLSLVSNPVPTKTEFTVVVPPVPPKPVDTLPPKLQVSVPLSVPNVPTPAPVQTIQTTMAPPKPVQSRVTASLVTQPPKERLNPATQPAIIPSVQPAAASRPQVTLPPSVPQITQVAPLAKSATATSISAKSSGEQKTKSILKPSTPTHPSRIPTPGQRPAEMKPPTSSRPPTRDSSTPPKLDTKGKTTPAPAAPQRPSVAKTPAAPLKSPRAPAPKPPLSPMRRPQVPAAVPSPMPLAPIAVAAPPTIDTPAPWTQAKTPVASPRRSPKKSRPPNALFSSPPRMKTNPTTSPPLSVWSTSFGTAPTSTSRIVNCSPLSSWFLSNGQANFIRQSNADNAHTVNALNSPRVPEMSATEKAFYDKLATNHWRSWYRAEDPVAIASSVLDPPLPNVPSSIQASVDAVNPISPPASAVPERRLSTYEKMMAALKREKEASASFEQKMIQVLQGKTMRGDAFEDAYRSVLDQ